MKRTLMVLTLSVVLAACQHDGAAHAPPAAAVEAPSERCRLGPDTRALNRLLERQADASPREFTQTQGAALQRLAAKAGNPIAERPLADRIGCFSVGARAGEAATMTPEAPDLAAGLALFATAAREGHALCEPSGQSPPAGVADDCAWLTFFEPFAPFRTHAFALWNAPTPTSEEQWRVLRDHLNGLAELLPIVVEAMSDLGASETHALRARWMVEVTACAGITGGAAKLVAAGAAGQIEYGEAQGRAEAALRAALELPPDRSVRAYCTAQNRSAG